MKGNENKVGKVLNQARAISNQYHEELVKEDQKLDEEVLFC